MGSGNLYARPANTKKNVKGSRLMRSFLFAGLLLLSMPFVSKAVPSFVHGATQTITVCQGSTNNTFGDALTITDTSHGITETWTLIAGPSNGLVSGLPGASASVGGILTTAGFIPTYTPNSGYFTDQVTVQVTDQNGFTATTTINIVVTPLPSMIVGSVPAVCAGSTSTTLSYSALANVGPTSVIYNTNGAFVIPPSVNSVSFDIQGAAGGGDSHSGAPNPGNGARVQGTLAVTPGHVLNVFIGGVGSNGSPLGAAGGANGGGNAISYFAGFGCGGGGGGATDLRLDGTNLSDRVVVAGGGGGNGWDFSGPEAGGDGGYPMGAPSAANVSGSHSGGGTQTSGGAHATYVGWTPGGNGTLGQGGDGSSQGISGGGGGGYYGGGGGVWTGGGGGSSYVNSALVSSPVFTTGYNIGAGIVSFNYNIPGSYDIYWDMGASLAGFLPVAGAVLPPSPLTIAVPAAGAPGTYNGTIVIHNASCGSSSYPFVVVINPIPDVNVPLNQTMCNGDTTSTIYFSGSVPFSTFNWTNDHPSIGLAANGSGDIPSFNAVNSSTDPLTALVTVTPTAAGCLGNPVSFTINVNPTPSLSTTTTPAQICDSSVFSYIPNSLTAGTTFTWFRDNSSNILEPGASGAGNPSEILYNVTPNVVTVPYLYTLEANGCINPQTVNVDVAPRPVLAGTLNAPSICNNSVFSYVPTSSTPGTTFGWSRAAVTGISNPANSGSGNPLETLHNTTTDSIVVPYMFTLTANGCQYTQTVSVTVYPSPMLSTTLAPAARCDSQLFAYAPNSATPGTTFNWSRAFIVGISNPGQSGSGNVNEYLVNTTAHPINVTYVYTSLANGCSNPQNVVVTINPKATLSSSLTPSVCDSTEFSYTPTSATTGTSFSWTRDTVAGISNPAGAGINNPHDTLINTTSHTIQVTYVYNMMANSCPSSENVVLTVNPRPKLSSSLTPPAICDSFNFNYAPTSNTAGASFAWYRPYIAGIYSVAQSGTGNPNQQLINSTYVVVDVTYNFTITANGCSNKQNVVVAVNPTPRMNPPYTATVCSGSPFTYTPNSYTPGATYAWNRPAVNHIAPATAFASPGGPGLINETLTDDQLVPQTVTYIYKLSVNGCTNTSTQNLRVTVNPAPEVPSINIYPSNFSPCNQTMFQNFGASAPEAANVTYHWSATNATIFAQGQNNQNVLVNFDKPGTAYISVNSNVNGYGCVISNGLTYNVGSDASETPQVIYYNGQFVCLKSDNSSYQWGYDDAVTLDSTLLAGEIDQTYSNGSPDFTDNHYWCMTMKNGCLQKSYYNAPSGVNDIKAGIVDMKVYPNPAKEILNVEINSAVVGKLNVEILNMLGQKLATEALAGNKGAISVAGLPSGAYLVDCYRDGVKIATTRFIKN